MVPVGGFQAFEENLDRGTSEPHLNRQVVEQEPGADRALWAAEQGAVSPRTGRQAATWDLTLHRRGCGRDVVTGLSSVSEDLG